VSNEFKGHDGSISRCKFLDDDNCLSTSGDKTIIQWDMNKGDIVNQYFGHDGDVLCCDVDDSNNTNFITGSIDKSAMLWDARTGQAELSFTGPGADINTIKYFPNKSAFAIGSDDGSIRLYDIRGDRELMVYSQGDDEDKIFRVVSLDFSGSGKYFFTACATFCYVWNTCSGQIIQVIEDFGDHLVSCVGVTPDGQALLASSWDGYIRVFA
jgi:guanine nucleotide-binding protein G(I)/G(S)/G(T) subunit beta-1